MMKLLLFLALMLSACASVQDHTQRLRISSDVEGVEIFHNGAYVATAPRFVLIPRKHKTSLTLRWRDKEIIYKMDGHYRWNESLVGNMLIGVISPVVGLVGFGGDFLSGAAWEYDSVPEFKFADPKLGPQAAKVESIAVAPPQNPEEAISDKMGDFLADEMHLRYPDAVVRPYHDVAPIFETYEYNNRSVPQEKYRNDLYFETRATHILETQTKADGGEFTLNSQLVDIYRDRQVAEFSFKQPESRFREKTSNWIPDSSLIVSIIPNSIGLESATRQLTINGASATGNYSGIPIRDNDFLRYLSAFGLRNLRSPKIRKKIELYFQWDPMGYAGYEKMRFEKTTPDNPIQTASVYWYSAGFGLGPEVGVELPLGYLYLNGIPGVGVDYLSINHGVHSLSYATPNIFLQIELGYTFFIGERLNFRLMLGRVKGLPVTTWGNFLSLATGEQVNVQAAQYNFPGISIEYFTPEGRYWGKRFFY